jgi:PhzF family phenazine biosynthesis protein
MKFDLYQIDAFTDTIFGGNPACVVPLDQWPTDEVLLKIAKENGVPETAFFIDNGDKIHLRWFTPDIEMDLCGHATLATAHCLKAILNYPKNEILFTSLSGDLIVSADKDKYTLDFPSSMPKEETLPGEIAKSLSIQPKEIYKSRDYMLVYGREDDIRNIIIDRSQMDKININPGGVIITAKGDNCDFVSRYFIPQASIFEDPVTGSAHCSLIPFWAKRLGKSRLLAYQLSERMGKLECVDNGERVLITGKARTYSVGTLWTD